MILWLDAHLFSCRHQIADLCDNRRSLHTAELLATRGERTPTLLPGLLPPPLPVTGS